MRAVRILFVDSDTRSARSAARDPVNDDAQRRRAAESATVSNVCARVCRRDVGRVHAIKRVRSRSSKRRRSSPQFSHFGRRPIFSLPAGRRASADGHAAAARGQKNGMVVRGAAERERSKEEARPRRARSSEKLRPFVSRRALRVPFRSVPSRVPRAASVARGVVRAASRKQKIERANVQRSLVRRRASRARC